MKNKNLYNGKVLKWNSDEAWKFQKKDDVTENANQYTYYTDTDSLQ